MHKSAPVTRASWVGIALLVLVVYEVGLMGSGRMLELGPLTLRMWLFLAGLIYAGISSFAKPKVSMASLLLCAALGALLSISVFIGVSSYAAINLVGEDVKPLSYFFLILFYESVIRTYVDVRLVVVALKRVSLILCVMYVVVVGLVLTKILSIAAVLALVSSSSDDFIFRGDSGMFVYKGALYIGVGLVFFLFSKGKLSRVLAVFCMLALLATGTRGFVVALLATALLYNLFSPGSLLRKITVAGTAAILGGVGWAVTNMSDIHGSSDAVRVITLHQVLNRVGFFPLLVGHGFGIGVPQRPVHMEIGYLETFHKQGMLGLAWWFAVFCLLFDRFQRSLLAGNRELAVPFLLSAIFVAIDSWTNPWISNPIGMAVLLLALACLRVLAQPEASENPEYVPCGFVEDAERAAT